MTPLSVVVLAQTPLTVTGVATECSVAGGAGADEFTFSNGSTGTSIYAGAGNDSVAFDGDQDVRVRATPTSSVLLTEDTLSFGSSPLVVVCGCGRRCIRCNFWLRLVCRRIRRCNWHCGNHETMLAGVATGTLFFSNVTDTTGAAGKGLSNITFVTVSTATITALG